MGSSPSVNVNQNKGLEKIQELSDIKLPNCDIDPSHRMMQLNMVCVDERCSFNTQLNPLCAECLEQRSASHNFSDHKCMSIPSILKEIGHQAYEKEKQKQQLKKNMHKYKGFSQQKKKGGSVDDENDNYSEYLEGIIKELQQIKAACRSLESNVRECMRTYAETKNKIILNSDWNVICKQYDNISSSSPNVSATILRNCFSELQHYCQIENQQVTLFDLEQTINHYLEQDTHQYVNQMTQICKRIEQTTSLALNLALPKDFFAYKQQSLTYFQLQSSPHFNSTSPTQAKNQSSPPQKQQSPYHIKQKETKDTLQQNFEDYTKQGDTDQQNFFKDSQITYYQQTKLTNESTRMTQQKWNTKGQNECDWNRNNCESIRKSQERLTPQRITDPLAHEREKCKIKISYDTDLNQSPYFQDTDCAQGKLINRRMRNLQMDIKKIH